MLITLDLIYNERARLCLYFNKHLFWYGLPFQCAVFLPKLLPPNLQCILQNDVPLKTAFDQGTYLAGKRGDRIMLTELTGFFMFPQSESSGC